jgi:hypothetical protein
MSALGKSEASAWWRAVDRVTGLSNVRDAIPRSQGNAQY